ncbi:MAG TPA: helix-turn-helix domain-containing protein [Nitrososphaerales archaeon]
MKEVTLLVKPPHTWVKKIVGKYPATVRLLDCRVVEGTGGVHELFEVSIDAEHIKSLLNDLRKDPYVYQVDAIETKKGLVMGSLKTRKCTACRSFATSECFLVSAKSTREGLVEWKVLSSGGGLKKLLDNLEKGGVEAEIRSMIDLKDENALTERQEEILQIALEKGYFDYPKKMDIAELAKLLGISKPTLSEILRRGQKKILAEHFRGRLSMVSGKERI